MLVVILLILLASGWITNALGVHALFGAFIVGVIMPKHQGLTYTLTEKLNDVAVVLLLPLFFAYIGLQTKFDFSYGGRMLFFAVLIVVTAVVGKVGGTSLAARATGMSWRDASSLGILMNTRGLMELVLLNIGLQIGVISQSLFALLVLMAISTTFMTSPLLEWIYYSRVFPKEPLAEEPGELEGWYIPQSEVSE
jgi:Kef-type K+ transport system membrane component KefB